MYPFKIAFTGPIAAFAYLPSAPPHTDCIDKSDEKRGDLPIGKERCSTCKDPILSATTKHDASYLRSYTAHPQLLLNSGLIGGVISGRRLEIELLIAL